MAHHSDRSLLHCEVAGAVAEAAIHDLRVNLFSFSGFPQIHVSRYSEDTLSVALRWETYETQFQLSNAEAKVAVNKFKSGTGFEPSIFDRVQAALAALDGKISKGRSTLDHYLVK